MRVLLVTHYFPVHRGGVEIVAGELARRLEQRGIELTWMASDESALPKPCEPNRLAVPAWNFMERRLGFPYPLWGPRTLLELRRQVRAADLVHLHDSLYFGNAVAAFWARWYRKPIVVTQHVGPIPYSSRLLRGLLALANRTLARWVLGGCAQAVFISPRVQSYFARLVRFRRPALYLANGVDTERFFPVDEDQRRQTRARLGWPADRKVRLFVGRFVEKKGLPFLRQLAESRPDDLWVFAGWGPHDPAAWGLSNVLCLGTQPQSALAEFYLAADLLVLPSVGEGFPLVVQEAMACGLPALISSETLEGAPDAAEVIGSAELKLSSWNEAIDRLDAADQPHERRRIAGFARRWSWDKAADRYSAMFKALVKQSTPATAVSGQASS